MKNSILLLIILILGIKTGTTQDLFYYTSVGKVYLEEMSNTQILVKFKEDMSIIQKNDILKTNNVLKLFNSNKLSTNSYSIIKITEYLTNDEISHLLDKLNENHALIFANPYYTSESGILMAYTNKVILKLSSESDYKKLISMVDSLNLSYPIEIKYMPGVYHFELTKKCTLNTLEIANYLYETEIFEWVEPNFVQTIKRF